MLKVTTLPDLDTTVVPSAIPEPVTVLPTTIEENELEEETVMEVLEAVKAAAIDVETADMYVGKNVGPAVGAAEGAALGLGEGEPGL